MTEVDEPAPRTFQDRTELRVTFYGCTLGRLQLERLIKAASEGTSENSVSVVTVRNNTKIERATLDDLVDAVHSSTEPGDPDVIDNLRVHAGDSWASFGIYMSIDARGAYLTVEGLDARQVRGRFEQLKALLAETGTESFPASSFEVTMATLLTSGLLSVIFAFIFAPWVRHHLAPVATINLSLVAAATCAAVMIGNRRVSKTRVKLNPSGAVATGTRWSRTNTADRIALGILAVTIVGVVVGIVTLIVIYP